MNVKRIASAASIALLLLYGSLSNVIAVEISVTDNSSQSASEVNLTQDTQTVVEQENTADIQNNVEENANTGDNSASANTSSDVAIATGDISSQTTIDNQINSSSAQSSCCQDGTSVDVSENGSDSTNDVNITRSSDTVISQSNTTTIKNNIVGIANTGDNSASDNSGGDITIHTGDIKVKTVVNNEPVNISSVEVSTGLAGDSVVKITGNGYDSENSVSANIVADTNVYTDFSADIENYIIWNANTGGNTANKNTEGDVSIITGDIDLQTFIGNFVNLGRVKVECCKVLPEIPEIPSNPGKPSEEKPGIGGASGDGGGGGQLLPEAAATEAGGPAIVGLGNTSGDNLKSILFIIGLGFFAIGGKLATDGILHDDSIE